MNERVEHVAQGLANDEAGIRRLAALVATELQQRASLWQRARPFLAGLSSALVVLLAFLVPAIQEQWDRFKARDAVDRYALAGRNLLRNEHYESAEQAYGRALELAGTQRLDLLEGQLRSRVMRIYDTPEWVARPDDAISEADFVYLMELEPAATRRLERASTVGAYGVYLAGLRRWSDAEAALKEAAQLDPPSALPHIHLGNLYDDLNRPAAAEAEYRRALALEPREASAHFNLGLLLHGSGRTAAAAAEFSRAVDLAPDDAASRVQLIEALTALGQRHAALVQAELGLQRLPRDPDIQRLRQRLKAGNRHAHPPP
jgi:tetratricopeptide (TPR) repeat protein